MHKSSCIHLSHSSIYNRKTSLTIFPSLELLFIVFPLNFIEFHLKGIIFWKQNPREVMSNIYIEISPMKLIDNVVINTKLINYWFKHFSNRNRSKMQIGWQSSSWNWWVVSLFIVILKFMYILQYLQTIFSSTPYPNIFIRFKQGCHFLGWKVTT